MHDEELKGLRAEIDRLDESLIQVLGERFRATEKVGQLKAAHQLQAVDPAREAAQAQRYALLAGRYGVPVALVQQLMRGIIDEVVANHKALRN